MDSSQRSSQHQCWVSADVAHLEERYVLERVSVTDRVAPRVSGGKFCSRAWAYRWNSHFLCALGIFELGLG